MADALIGYTGFVGSTLARQQRFDACYRSHDIAEIAGARFGTIVCAGAPAQKWLANRDPEGDRASLERLMRPLEQVRCERFVLISTVDVFADPQGVDEDAPVSEQGLHAYGSNRRRLEKFAAERFANTLVVRLPGLVGPGLRKNVLFDLLNDNQLDAIDSRAVFQFYPMVNLAADLRRAERAGLALLHLTSEPIAVEEVAAQAFGRSFVRPKSGTAPRYDFRTKHAALFGGSGAYQYSKREVLLAIRAYVQSEPKSRPGAGAPGR